MLRKVAAALLGATMLAGFSLAAPAVAGTYTTWVETSRAWDVSISDEHGTCSAFRRYENGMHFMLGWNSKNQGFFVGIGKRSWNDIKADETYTIRTTTDNQPWKDGKFTGGNSGDGTGGRLTSQFYVSTEFLIALAKANVVRFYQGDKFIMGLQLDGSYEAIGATLACQKAQDAKRGVTAPQQQSSKTWAVPIARHGTQITIEGKLNDKIDVTFTLDTGATSVSIPRGVAERLGLKTVRQVTITYGDGRKGTEDVVIIPKVAVGNVYVRDVEATVTDASILLLGKNFLDVFSSYEINNKQATLVLRQ